MRRITPIGTILNDMKLIQYSSLVEQKSEIRISFLVQCLICGNHLMLLLEIRSNYGRFFVWMILSITCTDYSKWDRGMSCLINYNYISKTERECLDYLSRMDKRTKWKCEKRQVDYYFQPK